MRTLLRWLLATAGSVVTFLSGRWLMGLSTPRKDARAARWWAEECGILLVRGGNYLRMALWRWLGIADWRLWRLREKYRHGRYGVEGT